MNLLELQLCKLYIAMFNCLHHLDFFSPKWIKLGPNKLDEGVVLHSLIKCITTLLH